jgi:putative hydrolase of HD superfamily
MGSRCIDRLAAYGMSFGPKLLELWMEYDAHQSLESRWVGVLDLLMPFIVNIATEGRNWQEQSISRSQVLHVSRHIRDTAPEIYEWMPRRIDRCVKEGWLRDE